MWCRNGWPPKPSAAWLDRRSAFAPAPTRPRPILLACGPSDLHTIGLESTAVLLRYQGWPCRVLGARTSTVTLAAAARAAAVAGVVVVSHLATGRLRAVESIRAIDDLGIEVFYAGNAFSTPRSRRGVPGRYLGVGIADACAQADPSLGTHRPRTGGSPVDLSEVVDCRLDLAVAGLSAPAETMQVAPETTRTRSSRAVWSATSRDLVEPVSGRAIRSTLARRPRATRVRATPPPRGHGSPTPSELRRPPVRGDRTGGRPQDGRVHHGGDAGPPPRSLLSVVRP